MGFAAATGFVPLMLFALEHRDDRLALRSSRSRQWCVSRDLAEPSDGLEPSTPSLPWFWLVRAVFGARAFCHRLPLVATAGLHKGSIPVAGISENPDSGTAALTGQRDDPFHAERGSNCSSRSGRRLAQARGRSGKVPLVPLTYTSCVTRLRSYWRWLGHRLRLSQPGRVFFTVALLVGVAGIAVARAHGDREGGAPLVVLALLLLGVVTLDAIGRGVVAVVRRLILDGGLRRHS
jgi:hypothetical protein